MDECLEGLAPALMVFVVGIAAGGEAMGTLKKELKRSWV